VEWEEEFSCIPSLSSPISLSAFTVPARAQIDESNHFSWLCIVRAATTTWRQCEFRRIEICDVEDVRNQKNLSVLIQVDSSGYGECNEGWDKVEEFRKGRRSGPVVKTT
jgi:hypothetical protein